MPDAQIAPPTAQPTPRGRTLLLTADTLIELENRAGRQVASEEDVLLLMDRLSSVKLGGITLPWAPAALAEIQYRAKKRGVSPEELIKQIVRKLSGEILLHVNLV